MFLLAIFSFSVSLMFFKCVQKSKGGTKKNLIPFNFRVGEVLITFHKAVTGLVDEERLVDVV